MIPLGREVLRPGGEGLQDINEDTDGYSAMRRLGGDICPART